MFTQVLYRSSSNGDLTPSQVNAILEKSVENNRRDSITGLLVYRDRVFLQLLEGDEAAVNRCLNRVRGDVRHFGVNVLMRVQGAERLFARWDMAFIPEAKLLKPLEYVEDVIDSVKAVSNPTRTSLVQVLQAFVKVEELTA